MTIATNSAGTRAGQVSIERHKLDDLRNQAQHANDLVMAMASVLEHPGVHELAKDRCIGGALAITQATWSALDTLLDMFHECVGPAEETR